MTAVIRILADSLLKTPFKLLNEGYIIIKMPVYIYYNNNCHVAFRPLKEISLNAKRGRRVYLLKTINLPSQSAGL